MKKVFLGVLGTGLAILCIAAVVEGGSGNTLLPEGMEFPNPMRKVVLRGQSAAPDSAASGSGTETTTESGCPDETSYLAIMDEECEDEQVSLYSNGPDSALLDALGRVAILVGRTGAVAVGSTESCELTPGVALAAYPSNSSEDPIQAGLLLTTCATDGSSWTWLATMDEEGDPASSLIMLYPGEGGDAYTFMGADRFSLTASTKSLSNGAAASMGINDENHVSVAGETVNVSNNNGSGVSVDANGNVVVQLGEEGEQDLCVAAC